MLKIKFIHILIITLFTIIISIRPLVAFSQAGMPPVPNTLSPRTNYLYYIPLILMPQATETLAPPTPTHLPPTPTHLPPTPTHLPPTPTHLPPTPTKSPNGNYYYIDGANGSDMNPGTSITLPWRTLQHGVDNVHPGDTIFIKGGIYYENLMISHSGQINNLITLTNYDSRTVTINGGTNPAITGRANYWEISGLTIISSADRTMWLEGISNWKIRHNRIVGPIYFMGVNNVIEGNDVDGSQHSGNENGIMDGSIDSHHNLIIGNTVHDFQERGIWSVWNTHDNTINNNHVYNILGSHGACIDLDSAVGVTYRNVVNGNIVHNCTLIGIELENSFATVVENNLVYNTGVEGIVVINYLGCEVGGENNQYGSPTGDCRGINLNTVLRQNIIYNGGTTGGIVSYSAAGVHVIGNIIYGGSSVALFLADDVNFSHNWVVYDNIFANNNRAEISVYNSASLMIDQFNLLYHPGINKAYQIFGQSPGFYTLSEWYTRTGLGQNSIESNPMFVNPGNFDLHLQPSSPVVNHGTDPGISTDFDGSPRPLGGGYDIGAYEQAGQ